MKPSPPGLTPRRIFPRQPPARVPGAALDDTGMARLAALNPETVALNGSPVTGNGAAKFGEMKSLKALNTMHVTRPTPEAKAALGTHPALEVFSSDGAFCIEAVTAP